jgi:hypothetical protein
MVDTAWPWPAGWSAIDLFVVPTAGFKLLYGLVIIRLQRRHLVWTNVTTNPTADWIARQITECACSKVENAEQV